MLLSRFEVNRLWQRGQGLIPLFFPFSGAIVNSAQAVGQGKRIRFVVTIESQRVAVLEQATEVFIFCSPLPV